MRRGGRAALLWGLAIYAAVQVIMNRVMDHHPPLAAEVWRDKKKQLAGLVAREPDRPLLLMLGSSRADCAFQAGRLNDLPGPGGKPYLAYNFGVPLAGPLCEYLFLRDMLDAGIRPRLLLLEFLPPFFNHPHMGITCEENRAMGEWLTLTQLLRVRPYFSRPSRQVHDWCVARMAPFYAFRPTLQKVMLETLSPGMLPPEDPEHDPWGYKVPRSFTPLHFAMARAIAHTLLHHSLTHFQLGKGASRAMADLLALCRREHIPVVLVVMPESVTLRSWYSPEGRTAPGRLLAQLKKTYNVPVIDATDWFEEQDFYDGQHLQEHASEVFTARLRDELRPILAALEDGPRKDGR